jgi:hypothetical protein
VAEPEGGGALVRGRLSAIKRKRVWSHDLAGESESRPWLLFVACERESR